MCFWKNYSRGNISCQYFDQRGGLRLGGPHKWAAAFLTLGLAVIGQTNLVTLLKSQPNICTFWFAVRSLFCRSHRVSLCGAVGRHRARSGAAFVYQALHHLHGDSALSFQNRAGQNLSGTSSLSHPPRASVSKALPRSRTLVSRVNDNAD